MLVVNIPIESLDERYSKQWNQWTEEKLLSQFDRHLTIYPSPIRDTIQDGAFLDTIGTTYFKSAQIAEVCRAVHNGEIPRDEKVVFYIQDGWFPVEQLAYLRDMLGCHEWKFIGLFHDGTYDKWDLTARNRLYTWGEELENSWFKIYDVIVVGSWYHQQVLLEERKVREDKIQVIPWYVEVPNIPSDNKENIVVFPHRLDEEKQPRLFTGLASYFSNIPEFSSWKFIRTKDSRLTKDEYYKLLAKSRIAVSFALLEMFGISMIEAALFGCVTLVPNRLSYTEFFRQEYRYEDMNMLIQKIKHVMREPEVHWSDPLQPGIKDDCLGFFNIIGTLIRGV